MRRFMMPVAVILGAAALLAVLAGWPSGQAPVIHAQTMGGGAAAEAGAAQAGGLTGPPGAGAAAGGAAAGGAAAAAPTAKRGSAAARLAEGKDIVVDVINGSLLVLQKRGPVHLVGVTLPREYLVRRSDYRKFEGTFPEGDWRRFNGLLYKDALIPDIDTYGKGEDELRGYVFDLVRNRVVEIQESGEYTLPYSAEWPQYQGSGTPVTGAPPAEAPPAAPGGDAGAAAGPAGAPPAGGGVAAPTAPGAGGPSGGGELPLQGWQTLKKGDKVPEVTLRFSVPQILKSDSTGPFCLNDMVVAKTKALGLWNCLWDTGFPEKYDCTKQKWAD
jgi:hypothetical protein